MSFASALNLLQPTLPYYLAVKQFDLLRITPHRFEFHPHSAAPAIALSMVGTVFQMGASSCIETLVMSRTLAEGPKLFTFDALTCEALENFDLSISTTDYQQPFPSVVIELPADYTRKRIVPFDAGQHSPDFVIVRHEPEAQCVMVAMHMTSHQVMTRLLKLAPAWTLEEMWAKGKRTWDANDSLDMTPEEMVLGSALSKMALNVCLMATAYGVRCLGPSNPSHYERLKGYVKVATKKGRERLVMALALGGGAGLLYQTQAAGQPKEEQRNKTTPDVSKSEKARPPKAADQREYVIMSRLVEAGADQPKEILRLPKLTLDDGQLAPLHITYGPQNLLAKVVDDEKIKIGTFFDVRVRRWGGNRVLLRLSFQRNEVEKSNVSEIRVLGNSVQAIQVVELHKPVKIVLHKDARGSSQRWVEITVDEQPSPAALPIPTR